MVPKIFLVLGILAGIFAGGCTILVLIPATSFAYNMFSPSEQFFKDVGVFIDLAWWAIILAVALLTSAGVSGFLTNWIKSRH